MVLCGALLLIGTFFKYLLAQSSSLNGLGEMNNN